MTNEFEELLTFNAEEVSYGEGGTEVPMDNLDTMESAVSHHMMDSPMDSSAGNLEQLGAETDPVASEEVPMGLENPLPSPPLLSLCLNLQWKNQCKRMCRLIL